MAGKNKERRFPIEILEEPKDFEHGEGLPRKFKDEIKRRFPKKRAKSE